MKASNIKGHCQACGRIQVVLYADHMMASHGYTVRSGYFSGVCIGHNYLPLEVSRERLDWVVLDLERHAKMHDQHVDELMRGITVPSQAFKRDQFTNIVHGERNPRTYERQPVLVNWSEASKVERDLQITLDIGNSESESRFARSHARSLTELAARVHGQPLIDRTAEEMAVKQARVAKSAPIAGAFRTKAAQKDALDGLNRSYEKIRRAILDAYLAEKDDHLSGAERFATPGGQMYDQMPFDLCHFRAKHADLVRKAYPKFEGQVREIERLAAERVAIKAMPVIK